jgi:hypothetical protein
MQFVNLSFESNQQLCCAYKLCFFNYCLGKIYIYLITTSILLQFLFRSHFLFTNHPK